MSTFGLSDVVRDGRLRHRVDGKIVPYAPTMLDDELLTAVDAATAAWIPLAVVLPLCATSSAVTLGAAATLAAVTRQRRLDVTCALVSKQLAHRALYDQLYLEHQRLRDFIPRSRLARDGSARAVGRARHDSGGRLLLTSDLTNLEVLDEVHALVLDATAVPLRALPRLLSHSAAGVTVVYLTGNPLDPALSAVRDAGGVVWSWDVDDLVPLAAPIRRISLPDAKRAGAPRPTGALTAPAELLTLPGSARRVLWMPDPPELAAPAGALGHAARPPAHTDTDVHFDNALAALWSAIAMLAAAYRPARQAASLSSVDAAGGLITPADMAMRWVWALFNNLTLLPVDPGRYDRLLPQTPWATRLTAAPEHARTYARSAPTALTDLWLRVAAALEELLWAAAEAPKLSRVLSWVAAVSADPLGDPLRALFDPDRPSAYMPRPKGGTKPPAGPHLVVVRNRTAASAVTAVLDEHPGIPLGWTDKVQVVSLNDVLNGRVAAGGHLLLCGAVPKSAAGLLAMPAATSLTVLAAGNWEGARVAQQHTAAAAALRGLRAETVALTAPRLAVAPHRVDLFGAEAILTAVSGGDLAPLPSHPEVPGWEPFDSDLSALLDRLGSSVSEDLPAAPVRDDSVTVQVIGLWLRDTGEGAADGVVLLAADDLIHRQRVGHLAQVAAKSVRPGDVLVLVDATARADLFASITARLGELPEYLPILALVGLWRTHAAAAANGGLTHEQILTRLQAAGSSITSPDTVGSWIRGEVHGPADPDDIMRFAGAIGDRELARRAGPIGVAVRALNATHRKVGRWLTGQVSAAIDRDDPEQLVDVTLEVHVSDLLESVSHHHVVAVDLTARAAPAAFTGTVLPADVAFTLGFRMSQE